MRLRVVRLLGPSLGSVTNALGKKAAPAAVSMLKATVFPAQLLPAAQRTLKVQLEGLK